MKRNLPLFLVINMLILLSSCASLNENSSKKAITEIEYDSLSPKLSKEELAKVIKAKIDNREYRIDIQPEIFHRGYGVRQYVPGYIQVCGDSVISCMSYDNPFKGDLPPKNYVEHLQSIKYEILDYKQTETSQGMIIISFWFKIKYKGDDHYLLTKFKDRIVPVRYKLEFRRSTKVNVFMDDYLTSGTLML